MNTQQAKWMRRKRRHQRIRNRVKGTSSCPRLSVYRSLRHIYGQLIDDERGATLVSVCTLDSDLRDQVPGGNRDSARTTGKLLAEIILDGKASSLDVDLLDLARFEEGRLIHEYNVV